MAKHKKKKIKKYVFKPEVLSQEYDFSLIGIQTQVALYKLVFDFNNIFSTGFFLNKDLIVERKNKKVAFQNYTTKENNIGQKIYIFNNIVLEQVEHPNTLFDTFEAFYLFPNLKNINYLLIIPNYYNLNLQDIKQHFKSNYRIKWMEVDISKCATVFPFFTL